LESPFCALNGQLKYLPVLKKVDRFLFNPFWAGFFGVPIPCAAHTVIHIKPRCGFFNSSGNSFCLSPKLDLFYNATILQPLRGRVCMIAINHSTILEPLRGIYQL